MKKVIFFDRDNTLIKDVPYLNDPNGIELFDDTIETLLKLAERGYEFIIVTNQSGIARGLITKEQLIAIHEKLVHIFNQNNIDILAIYNSPYGPESNHPTRKPNPGMLLQAFEDYNIDKANSYMVGDKLCDGQAGLNAGIKSFVLNINHPEMTPIHCLLDLVRLIP